MEGHNASSGSLSNASQDHKRDGEDSNDRGNNQERRSSDSSRYNEERRLNNVDEIVITMITLVAIATSGNVVVHDQSWMTAAIVQSGSFIPPPSSPPSAPAPAPTPTRVINANDAIPPPDEGCSSGQLPPKKRKRAEQQVHECGICGKVFSTGQALGGHMRAHYQGDLSRTRRPNNANSNVAIASSAASVAPTSYPGVTINNNNVINSEVETEIVVGSTVLVVEHVANESDRAASHPRLDIDLNVKPAEMSSEEEEEPDENLEEEEGYHSYGD